MGDEKDRIPFLMICRDILRYDADSIDIESRVCFIEHRELRIEDPKLQDLALLAFPAGEAVIQVAVCVGRIHGEVFHALAHETL